MEESSVACKRGDVIVFPSYLHHRVKPVTKGVRYSIVAWYGGPPFK
ncbi:MAG: 2OG-Fe(II) oxygenase [Pseudomonadota bacterium]|nr:2OG-Fe(II) oxygenase [Pseudomonadota bacterium]